MQPREPLQKDYQQRQVHQSDAVVTFVTPPPPLATTKTTHYNDEIRPKNHVQHFVDEIDDFRNHYRYVNGSELPEGYNNKHRNVTHITNGYGTVDEYRKNSNFGFLDEVLEKNKTRSQNNYNNRVNAAKEQTKYSPQVFNTKGEIDEENNERPPQSYDLDLQLNPRQNAHHHVNTDVLLQLAPDENNKHGGQISDVKSVEQMTHIRTRESQHFHLLDGESKSNAFHDHSKNANASAYLIDQENSHNEVFNNNNMYNSNAVYMADGNDDIYRDDIYYPLQYANGVVDGWVNSEHHDAIVDTDSNEQKHEDDRKFVNLKFDQDGSKNKQRVSSNQYVNMNVTAASLEGDSVVINKRPRGHNDDRGEIEHQHRQKPSVIGGAEVNSTTVSARPQRRKVKSSAKSRRPASENNRENDYGSGSRTQYDGQNGYERKYNRNDRERITTPSNTQPSVMNTSRASFIEDVVDGDDDDSLAEEELEQTGQGGYGFGYTVLDENVGMDFGQWERREPGRAGTVTGLYRVKLPDGRTQTVEYTVGPATGYKASVTYEGVQRHPSAAPPPHLVESV
ncbi:hypothetical protein ACI65C_010061 [Semiaphis heraclei]